MQVANLLIIAVAALIIIGIGVAIFMAGIVSASPGEVKVISGRRGIRVLQGKTGWRVPFIERVDSMTASMVSIDVKTNGSTPTNDFINVQAEAEVKVRIGLDRKELFEVAARNFLGRTDIEIADSVRETLEGHLRSIIGEMELKAIVQDRQQLANKVQENATNDLEEMGLEIVAFNIQTVRDDKGVIETTLVLITLRRFDRKRQPLRLLLPRRLRNSRQALRSSQTTHVSPLIRKSLRGRTSSKSLRAN